jgi:hypothetical protein
VTLAEKERPMHRQRLWQCVWGIVLVAGAGLSAQAPGV